MTDEHMTGAEALVRSLLEAGAETVFGYPGGAILPVYDKLYDYADRLRHILVRHEQGAVHAAQGFARVSGRTGVVIVTSPQDLVQMIVKKAYNMAKQMNIPVLGIVENYSYVKCPDCGKELKVFGESHIEEIAKELDVPVLGKMPLDPLIAEAVEEERFHEVKNPYLAEVDL